MGLRREGARILFEAVKRENQTEALGRGLWYFGRRFLVYSDNHGRAMPADLKAYSDKGYCRGACYWLIEKFLRNPAGLVEAAREFEKGAPDEAAQIHESLALPPQLTEERIWAYRLTEEWNEVPLALPRGVYSFRLGSWKNENEPVKSHRFVLFKEKEPFLFDPSIGLAAFQEGDWIPHLKRTAGELNPVPGGYFTIECFRHSL
jgi:hypothetical protein